MSIPDIRKCKFSTYGVKCGVDAIGSDYCEKHEKMMCCSCGNPATHGCAFCGQFVCGAPLCDDCTYGTEPGPSGNWGFLNHVHIRKGAPLPSEIRKRDEEERQLLRVQSLALGLSEEQP